MKERYIERFGNSYGCSSPNEPKLKRILKEECAKHGILVGSDNVFKFISRFPGMGQTSLF
jgi:hypothetical protein